MVKTISIIKFEMGQLLLLWINLTCADAHSGHTLGLNRELLRQKVHDLGQDNLGH